MSGTIYAKGMWFLLGRRAFLEVLHDARFLGGCSTSLQELKHKTYTNPHN